MKLRILLVFLLGIFLSFEAFANEKDVIRVGISNQTFSSWEYQNVKLSSEDVIKIIDMSKNEYLKDVQPNQIIEVVIQDGLFNIYIDNDLKHKNLDGPIIFTSNSELQLVQLNRKGMPAKYKGMIELKKINNKESFNVINILDMQNYLRGVVSNEMPVSFGLEALKAQSMAARNYATNANMNPNYDLVDSTAAQVYYGANSYKQIADEAVEKTKGIYILYNEQPISALYFSTSPGITDDWDDVFGDGTKSDRYPYLKARTDFEKQGFLESEKEIEAFYRSKDNGLDVNSPRFRWEYEFDRKELEEILHNTLQQQSKVGNVEPKYDGDIPIYGLKKIKALKRTKSGKITELLIEAKTGEYIVKKEIGIRRVLRKNNSK